ncbi:hypothetical protein LQ564_00140 [Massilia sp. G4R7]|uniref:Uncharacterized protein n=1 Tax=Massilia phyllostachyos TaxID=2898585 RepID=A0ABS8PYY7_9BURK|nr:hypothetical protein [Massilia phyllostachyos]MCD2514718.1 hypothetical protein [Massilia phyllostachyos]
MANQNSKKKYRMQGAETAHLAQRLGVNDQAAIAELKKLAGRVNAINASKAAMSLDQRAGFIFEEVHAGTFNAAARKAGDFKSTALTGSTGGFAGDPRVDLRVVRDGKIVAEAQAKCCGSAARSAVSSAKPQYAGTQRIVPDDQVPAVRDMLSKSAKAKASSANPRMRQIGANRQEAATKVSGKLKAAGHESKAVTHAEAQVLASGDTSSITRVIVSDTLTSAASNAAKSGLAVSAAISAVSSLSKLASGDMSAKEATKAVVTDGVSGAARSAATAVAAEGVKEVAKRALSTGAAKAFVAGSGPLAVAGCAVELVTDACKGELTVGKAARSATRAAGGWAGAEGGALVGSMIFPGPGTVIGAVIGGIGGSLLGGWW